MIRALNIVICCLGSTANSAEVRLAEDLSLPLLGAAESVTTDVDLYLRFESRGLTLYRNVKSAPTGLRIDFTDPGLQRRSADHLLQQNLCKAVGLKRNKSLRVLDATAGLGKDAWLLASAGAEVQLLERSSIVHALLSDGMRRGNQQGSVLGAILARMALQQGDFIELAPRLPTFDVVYLDPMFPPRNKNAKAKREVHMLQTLLGDHCEDESRMLSLARQHASRRVVVKRGRLSPHLAAEKPDIEYKGSSNRYDVYVRTDASL